MQLDKILQLVMKFLSDEILVEVPYGAPEKAAQLHLNVGTFFFFAVLETEFRVFTLNISSDFKIFFYNFETAS